MIHVSDPAVNRQDQRAQSEHIPRMPDVLSHFSNFQIIRLSMHNGGGSEDLELSPLPCWPNRGHLPIAREGPTYASEKISFSQRHVP